MTKEMGTIHFSELCSTLRRGRLRQSGGARGLYLFDAAQEGRLRVEHGGGLIRNRDFRVPTSRGAIRWLRVNACGNVSLLRVCQGMDTRERLDAEYGL